MNKRDFLKPSLDFEAHAEERLREVLGRVPFLELGKKEAAAGFDEHDFTIEVTPEKGKPWTLVCEAKSTLRHSVTRMAVITLHSHLHRWPERSYGVLITPFVSDQTALLCKKYKVGYVDLAGNCCLCFDKVYIETSGRKTGQPSPKKQWPSLFGTKSARVLRRLLRDPAQTWKVQDLARVAGVSVGLVSNVRRALLEQGWAGSSETGVRLRRPDVLLDTWRRAYKQEILAREGFHTILHGSALVEAVKTALASAGSGGNAVLHSTSAAQWLAPYVAGGPLKFYADQVGAEALREVLRLKPTARGANVFIDQPKDDGVFLDAIEPSLGIRCTSAVQTYLDLSVSDGRSAEAAEHLREQLIAPLFKSVG